MNENKHIPNHIAIIMDGNGRWASQRGEKRLKGHQTGVESVRIAIETAGKMGVKWLTLYAFSTENWGRPKEEVEGLMTLFCEAISTEIENLNTQGIRLRFMGRVDELPSDVKENIKIAEELTKNNDRLNVVIAINYGSQLEITDAVRSIANQVKLGEIEIKNINLQTITDNLYVKDMPQVDLLIRTSGECRISNFMLWQISYAELYFTSVLWPDIKSKDIIDAIEEYSNRNRRYGLVK